MVTDTSSHNTVLVQALPALQHPLLQAQGQLLLHPQVQEAT